jgi:hypothetical protein
MESGSTERANPAGRGRDPALVAGEGGLLISRSIDPILPGSDRANPGRNHGPPGEGRAVLKALQQLALAAAIVVHVGTAAPIDALGDRVARSDAPAADDCCVADGSGEDPGTPTPDDCCADHCRRCPLPCCGGSGAVLTALPATPGAPPRSASVPAAPRSRIPGTDPSEIYHPPRA